MAETRTVAVKLRADASQYTTTMKQASTATAKFDAAQSKAQKQSEKWRAVGMASQIGGAAMAAGLLAAAKAASNQEQAMGSLTAVFKANGEQMTTNAKNAAGLGLSTTAYANAAAKLGAQLSNLGVDQANLGGTTDDLIRKAGDLAAQFGGTTQEAVDALGAAMRGEADPAERYGLALNITAVNAEMAATGADKATAMMSLLNKQMTKSGAVGAWNREIGTSAAQMQMARAEFDNAAAALGESLLPAMAAVANKAGAMLRWFNELPEPMKQATTYLGAFAAAALMVVPKVADSVSALNDLRTALVKAGEESVTTKGKLANVATTVGKGGALVLGLAAVMTAVEGMNDKVSESTGINDRWLDALGRIASTATPATLPVGLLSEAVRQLGISMGMVPEELDVGVSPELEEYARRVREGEGSIRVFADAVNAGVAPAEAFAQAQQAIGFAAGRAAGGIGDSATATGADIEAKEKQAAALKEATAQYEAYIAAVQQALGLLSARDALIGQEDRLAEAVKKNGNALKGRTAAAAANRAAMSGEITKITDLVQSTFESTKAKHGEARALEEAEKVRLRQVAVLKRSAAAAGYDREQVKALIKQTGLVKPVVTTTFMTPGLQRALDNVKGLGGALGAIAGSVINIPVSTGRQGRAAGGFISGAGSGTSDSIPANLSNGEYVLRASAVKRIGVDELDAMNYARGGKVGKGRGKPGRRQGGGGGGRAGRPGRPGRGDGGGDMGFGEASRAVEKWGKKVENSKQKLADLKSEAADYANSISQNILSSAGGGLFDMFKKSDMAANAEKLASAQDKVAEASRRLYEAQVAVNTASPDQRADALKNLADAQRDLADATGEQTQAEQEAAASAPTPTNIMGKMRDRAVAIENYASKVKALMGRGLSIELIKELAGADMMEAGPVLDALLAMPADALAELGSLDKRAKDAAASVGSAVSGAAFAPQMAQAETELSVNTDGLEDALDDADKTLTKKWRKVIAKAGLSVEERAQLMQSLRNNDGKLTRHWRTKLAMAGLGAEERKELMDAITGGDTTMGREWRDKLQKTGLSAEEKDELAAELANAKNPDRALRKHWVDELQKTGLSAAESQDLYDEIANTKKPGRKLRTEWMDQLMATGLTAKEAKEMIGDIQTTHGVVDANWTNAERKKIGLGARDGGIGGDIGGGDDSGNSPHGIVNTQWRWKKKDIGLGASGKGMIEGDIGGDNDQGESPHGKVNRNWTNKKKDIGLGAGARSLLEDIGVDDNAQDDGPMGKVNKQWRDKKKNIGLGARADDVGISAGTDAAKKAIRDDFRGFVIHIGTAVGAGAPAKKKAIGGMVIGPGTGTSDTAGMFALSNGEYVVRAASVAKYGQQFFDAVNAGRLASGGPVGYRTTTTAPMGGASGVAVTTSTVPVIVQLDGREIAKSQLKVQRQSGGTITVGG